MTARRFLTRTGFFSAVIGPVYFAAYEAIYELHHFARTRNDPSAVYVIGDSRMFNATDITALRERTGRPIYSYAQHAMSDYALMKMAEMIPPGATVLFGPSWGLLVRDKDDASYRSGYSIRGLWRLLTDGGEYWHFRRIFVVNRNPLEAPFFHDTPYALAEADVRNLANFEKVKSFYAGPKPPWVGAKKRMVTAAIETMLDKGCRLEVIDVPIPDDIRYERDELYGSVLRELGLDHPSVHIHEDIPLVDPEGKNVWQDADHMNGRGRRQMTEYLIQRVLLR